MRTEKSPYHEKNFHGLYVKHNANNDENNITNLSSLASLLKKKEHSQEMKIISHNNSKSEIKPDNNESETNVSYTSPDSKKFISRNNKNNNEILIHQPNSKENKNTLSNYLSINNNALSNKETEESLDNNLFTFSKNEKFENIKIPNNSVDSVYLEKIKLFKVMISNLNKSEIEANEQMISELKEVREIINNLIK